MISINKCNVNLFIGKAMAFVEPGSTERVPSNPTTTTEAKTLEEYKEETDLRDQPGRTRREYTQLYYPLDMRGNSRFPGSIKFRARQLESQSKVTGLLYDIIDGISKKITSFALDESTELGVGSNSGKSEAKETGAESEKSEREVSSEVKNEGFLSGALDAISDTFSDIADWANGPISTQSFRDTLLDDGKDMGFVKLPLRQQLQFTDRLDYQNADLGLINGAIETAASSGQSAVGSSVKAILQSSGAFLTGGPTPQVSAVVLKGLETAGLPSTGLSSGSRISSNPNSRTLFKSSVIRNFAFSFSLVARNPKEAEEIKKIIKFFRISCYPDLITLGNIPAGYIFPDLFDIFIEYRGKPIATRILPCYLTTIDITYNTPTTGMHADGNFTEIGLNLTFTEAFALNRARINQGY